MVYFAAERTLLAWLRAALALVIFGFAIDRFGLFLPGSGASANVRSYQQSYYLWIGAALVGTGAAMGVFAAIRYFRFARHYRRESSTDPGRGLSMAVFFMVLITIMISGMTIFLIIMIR